MTLLEAILPPGLSRTEFVQYTLLLSRDPHDYGRDIETSVVCNDDPGALPVKMYLALTALAGQWGMALTEPVVRVEDGGRWGHEHRVVVTAGLIR